MLLLKSGVKECCKHRHLAAGLSNLWELARGKHRRHLSLNERPAFELQGPLPRCFCCILVNQDRISSPGSHRQQAEKWWADSERLKFIK